MSNELIRLPNYLPDSSSKHLVHLSKLLDIAESRLIPYRNKDKWGFSDINGSIVIPCIYRQVKNFNGKHAVVELFNGKQALIDKSHQLIIPPYFDWIYHIGEGFVSTYTNNNTEVRLFNNQGQQIGGVFSGTGTFYEGYAKLTIGDWWNMKARYGFVDCNSNIYMLEDKYKYVTHFNEGFCGVTDRNNKCGYINRKFDEVIKCRYGKNGSEAFWESYACVSNDKEKFDFINKNDELVIPMLYDFALSFNEGLAVVAVKQKEDYRHGYIDKMGQQVISLKFDRAGFFSNSYAVVAKTDSDNYKYGVIDKSGDLIIDYKYDDISQFSRGGQPFAQVKKDGYEFKIDMQENIVSEEDLAIYNGGIFKTEKGYSNINGVRYWND